MPKALVTGGAGFIGSHLCESLLRAGMQVVVADDLSTGKKSFVPKAAKFKKIDVRTTALADLIKEWRPDYICHLAAQRSAAQSRSEAVFDAQVNVVGTVNALSAAAKIGVKKFLFVSSAAVYGAPRQIPTPEDTDFQFNSPYAVSKFAGEQYVEFYQSSFNLPTVILRLANVYGPRQDAGSEGGVVAKFASALVSNKTLTIEGRGEQTRDFIYVADIAQGLLTALLDGRGVYNLGTSQEVSIRELAIKLGEVAGTVPRVNYSSTRPDDILRSALSALRANRELKWHAATPLVDGLRQTLKWYKDTI